MQQVNDPISNTKMRQFYFNYVWPNKNEYKNGHNIHSSSDVDVNNFKLLQSARLQSHHIIKCVQYLWIAVGASTTFDQLDVDMLELPQVLSCFLSRTV